MKLNQTPYEEILEEVIGLTKYSAYLLDFEYSITMLLHDNGWTMEEFLNIHLPMHSATRGGEEMSEERYKKLIEYDNRLRTEGIKNSNKL